MRLRNFLLCATALTIALAVAGCGNRLVADKGEKTVRVFGEQDTYEGLKKIRHMVEHGSTPQEVSAGSYLLKLGADDFHNTKVDAGTRVKIITTNPVGSTVEVLEGPNKGLKGFVGKENLR